MEEFYILLGLVAIYATIHFGFIQMKAYNKRTQYEKVVTWFAIVFIALTYIGVMSGT